MEDILYIALAVVTFVLGFAIAKVTTKKTTNPSIGVIIATHDDSTNQVAYDLKITKTPTVGINSINVVEEHINFNHK